MSFLIKLLGLGREKLSIRADCMGTTLHYAETRRRLNPCLTDAIELESACGPVKTLKLLADASNGPQAFVSTGTHIFEVLSKAEAEREYFPRFADSYAEAV